MGSFAQVALALGLACAVSGCATYVDHLGDATRATEAGNYDSAIAALNDILDVDSSDELPNRWSGDRPLAALERGTLQQAASRFPASARDFSAAEQELELLDLKTDPVAALGAYVYSDSAKTYQTPPTERLSLNAVNLLNFLARGDLEGAAVEARRFQVMRDYLASLDIEVDGPARLGTYLAGFVFEHRGEGDRALRYYEETLAGGPLASLDAPIRRLARVNPYRGPRLSEVLAGAKSTPTAAAATPELLIVLSLGRVPHKQAQRIPIGAAVSIAGVYATGNIDWLKYGAAKFIAYPELVSTPSLLGEATLLVDGQAVAVETLTDLGAAIRQEYEEAKPKIIAAALTRMAARAAVAEGIRAGGRQESDALGDLLAILFESTLVALDRPDTRSWTMLPERVLVARLPLAAGQHSVDVSFGGGATRNLSIVVPATGGAAVVITEPR